MNRSIHDQHFDFAFHNLRGRLCLLPLHDQFLEELVSAGVLNNDQRYLIFSSPRPTVYSCIRRGIALLRILWSSSIYLPFCQFLRQITSQGRSDSDFLAIREFILYMETEFSNSPLARLMNPEFA